MAKQKTSSEDSDAQRAPVLDDFALPFPELRTPARRRQPRQKTKRSSRAATPPERSEGAGAELPPPAPPSEAEPSQEATAPLPAAARRTPSSDADVSRPSVVAKPGPRLYKLSNPVAQAFLQALNDICNADDPQHVRVVAEKVSTDHSPTAGETPQAHGLRRVVEEVAKLADETGDMARVRTAIDDMLAPLDRTAAKVAQAEAASAASPEPVAPTVPPMAPPSESVPEPASPSPQSPLTTVVGPSGVDGLPAEYNDGVQWRCATACCATRQPSGSVLSLGGPESGSPSGVRR